MGDEDEGENPYLGRYCLCGLRYPEDEAAACPDCKAPWPAALVRRYPYDGGPVTRSRPGKLKRTLYEKELERALRECRDQFELMDGKRRTLVSAPEDERVKALGQEVGFGALMDSAQRMWARHNEEDPWCVAGTEFTLGSCQGTVENIIKRIDEVLR